VFTLNADGLDIADVILDGEKAVAMVDITGDELQQDIKDALKKHFPELRPEVEYFGINYT